MERPSCWLRKVADDVEDQRVAALAVAGEEGAAEEKKDGLGEQLITASYFALWYILNVAYNIYNKKLLNSVPLFVERFDIERYSDFQPNI